MSDIENTVLELLRTVFEAPELVFDRSLTALDIEGWNSLSNIKLIVELEKAFGIRFSAGEVIGLKNVGALVDLIASKSAKSA